VQRFHADKRPVRWEEACCHLSPPTAVLDQLPLRPDMTIADVGCGAGFFTLPLAERLPCGRVHAVDSDPALLAAVRARASAAGRRNVTLHRAATGHVAFARGSLDAAFLALTFRRIPIAERARYLAGLRPLMRPGGWLAILEWTCRRRPGGGPPLAARVTPEATCAALLAGGWQAVTVSAAGERLYLVIARPCRGTDDTPP